MRLLDAWLLVHEGTAELVNFPDVRSAPPYAILSHTWGDEEVLFEDVPLGPNHEIVTSRGSLRASRWQRSSSSEPLGQSRPHVKAGWNKVLNTCLRACQDSLEYVWIDTCCIDKSSSAELSEAINSMYLWYKQSNLCYVLLSDFELCPDFDRVTAQINLRSIHQRRDRLLWFPWSYSDDSDLLELYLDRTVLNACMRNQLRQCKWFTRGWTLQELLAPRIQMFFDKRWQLISNKSDILPTLASVTGVPRTVLATGGTSEYSVAQRMFWASQRKTTRIEDEAYSLLGIFAVSMPLIYGGGTQAFRRLQEEIIKVSQDHSIFAWELRPGVDSEDCFHCLFAPSVANFWWLASSIRQLRESGQATNEYHLTNQGVELQLCLDPWRQECDFPMSIAYLECCIEDNDGDAVAQVGIRLRNTRNTNSTLGTLQILPEDRMYTQVEVELVSSIEEPVPTFRRLCYLVARPPSKWQDWRATKLFLFRDQNISCKWNHEHISSFFEVIEIELKLRGPTLRQNPWRVTAVHPRSQWHAKDRIMILPLNRRPVFVCVEITSRIGFKITLIIGVVNELWRSSNRKPAASKCGDFQYWILQGSAKGTAANPEIGSVSYLISRPKRAMHICYRECSALQFLCDQAASFARKDFFENSTQRVNGRKCAHLPNGDILRVQIEDVYQIKHLKLASGMPRKWEATYRLVVEPTVNSTRNSVATVPPSNLRVSFGREIAPPDSDVCMWCGSYRAGELYSEFREDESSLESESEGNTDDRNGSIVSEDDEMSSNKYESEIDCDDKNRTLADLIKRQ